MYSVEKTKSYNYVKQFDYALFVAVLILSIIGLFVLNSATRVMPGNINGDRIMLMQSLGFAIGVSLSIIISTIDYKDFKIIGIVLYIFSIILLVLVLFIGTGAQQGSQSWLRVPLIGSFQPSELAKITMVVFVSTFLERIKEGQKNKNGNIAKFAVYCMLPIGLVLLEPDFGTAMVFIFIIVVMVYICGLEYKYFWGCLLASIPVIILSWFFVLQDYQKSRILAFLAPEKYKQGASFNVTHSITAIGSGQIFGKGLYQGIQTQNAGVPVKESDFIFSVIGEELGFIGAMVVLVLIFFILIRCVYIAKKARDSYGSFLVIGLTGMLSIHFIENIGMCIGILPVTGIPLPFISSGGSAMVTNYIAVGIILSVSMRRQRTIFNNTQ
ncbi:MAG: rod shape-determining protein RodA [Clostridiales bacterium]|jgi:rod shape determining protein RodA|nr:rod shape-determining protein RodA [Eubacteriales bacterium]MDH7564927.1 rod shape-determining protein RodA [Clostridiales bacterium]